MPEGEKNWGASCNKWGQSAHPDFGRIESAAGQRGRATLLLANPDFQTLRHPCNGFKLSGKKKY